MFDASNGDSGADAATCHQATSGTPRGMYYIINWEGTIISVLDGGNRLCCVEMENVND